MIRYNITMMLHSFNNIILCKAFSSTLRKATEVWFKQLLINYVSSFKGLSKLFKSQVMANKPLQKDTLSLYLMKQGINKPLCDFTACFNKIVHEIPNLDEGVTLHAATQGVNASRAFFKSLAKNKP